MIHEQAFGASFKAVDDQISEWAGEIEKRLMPRSEWGMSERQQQAAAAAEAMFGPA